MKFLFESQRLNRFCQQNDSFLIGLFGSMAGGDGADEIDIDLLLQFSGRKNLLTLFRFVRELTTGIGGKVDIATESSLNFYLLDDISHDLQVIHEAYPAS